MFIGLLFVKLRFRGSRAEGLGFIGLGFSGSRVEG